MTSAQWLDLLSAIIDFGSPIAAAGVAEYIRARMAQTKNKKGPEPDDDTGTA